MAAPLVFPLIARDGASATFNRVAAAADRAAVSTERASKSFIGIQKSMASTGATLSKRMTLPLVAAAGIAVDQAAKFQRSMLLVQTQAGASAREVKKLSAAVLELAPKVGTGPDKLATSIYHIESVGLRGAKALHVLKIAAEGAKVGNADLEETTNALTSTVASGIKGVTNMSKAMGSLNSIVGSGDMKLSDLNEALGGGILSIAKEYNVSLTQVGAALATFGDNNIRGADAATKLRMSIMDMAKPAAKADDYLSKIGLSSAKLRKAMAGSGGLTGALDLLSQHMDKAGITGGKVGSFLSDVFTKRAGAGLAVLIGQMDRYHTKLDEVSGGASKFGSEWQATTKTTSFQFDQMVAGLESAGIKLGTQLLPVFTKIVNGISGAVTWFSHLNTTQTKILLWSAGVLAAVGPVMAIGSRLMLVGRALGTFASLVAGTLARLAGVSAERSAMIATSMGRITGAIAGVGIGLAVGQLTKNASTGAKWLGILGSAAAGAAIGFGAGGPVGAVIGGIAGGVSALASSFDIMGGKADAASKEAAAALKLQQGAAAGLLGTLQSVNGAYGKQTRIETAQALSKSGALDIAAGQGINLAKLTSLTLQGKAASWVSRLGNLGKIDSTQGAKLADILGNIEIGASAAEGKWERLKLAVGGTVVPTKQLAGGVSNLHKELKGTNTDLQYQVRRWNEVNGKWGHYSETVNRNSADAKRNTQVVQDNIGWIRKQADQQLANGKSIGAVTKYWDQNSAALKQNLVHLGFSSQAVNKLFQQIGRPPKAIQIVADSRKAQAEAARIQARINAIRQGKVPSLNADPAAMLRTLARLQMDLDGVKQKIIPNVDVNSSQALTELGRIQAAMDSLHSKSISITTYERQVGITGPHGTANTLQATRATGGGLPNGWSLVGERGAELVWKAGGTAHVYSNPQSKQIVAHTGMRVPGFAAGTNPSAAAATAVGNVGSLPSPKFTLGKLGDYRIVMRQIAHGWSVLSAQIAHGLSKSAAAHYRKLLNEYTREAKHQLMGLERTVLSAPLQKQLTQLDMRLANARQRLASIKSNRAQLGSSVSGAITGTFDVTTAGVSSQVFNDKPPGPISGSSILAQLTKAANQAKRFGHLLRRLKKEGLPQTLLIQLAQAGPAAMPQALALADASPKTLANIKSEYKTLTSAGTAAGNFIGTVRYGAAQGTAQGVVDGLVKNRKKIVQRLKDIMHEGAAELAKDIAKSQHHGGHGGKHEVHHHYETHVHGVSDASAAAAAVERRQKMKAKA